MHSASLPDRAAINEDVRHDRSVGGLVDERPTGVLCRAVVHAGLQVRRVQCLDHGGQAPGAEAISHKSPIDGCFLQFRVRFRQTPAEIVTIASMIQSETRLDEERPDVAQVVYNRLTQGIPLGIDATLAFGLNKSGNDLTVSDLRTDSPYNTRTRGGLPPTPISSPGEASLEAALAPTTGDLLYYVLESSDGNHFFTADYAEFQAARQRCADAGTST